MLTVPIRLVRPAGLVLALAVVAGLLAALVAPVEAQGPRDRKRAVDRAVDALKAQLNEHSAAVAQAAVLLRNAEAQLPAAQAKLAQAEKAVALAREKDAAAAARLKAAERREQKAADELADVQGRISSTENAMGEIARENYQRGGVYGELALIMEADSPQDLTTRVSTMRTVLRTQQDVVEQLDADRADLAIKRSGLQAVSDEVATLREEAADRLAETRAVEGRAQAAKDKVSRLVRERDAALAKAEAAEAEDERRYQQLRAESRRLAQILAGGSGVWGASGNFIAPVSGPITSPYGMRTHPITGEYKLHDGTDFSASCGTPIRAATKGQVVRATALTGYGNQVALNHGQVNGVQLGTSYNHLSQFAVSSGEQVSGGEVIGYVGSTGYSTGCHLHFMVYENGGTVDPMKYL